MRVDLVSRSVSLAHITAIIEAEIDLMRSFGEETAASQRRRRSITGGYRKSGAWHQVIVSVTKREPGWVLSIQYSCPSVEGHPLSPPSRDISQAMGRIEQVMRSPMLGEVEADIYGHADYNVDTSGMEMLLPLPLLRVNDPSAAFTEITGVRLLKESAGRFEYRVTLDTGGRENRLSLSVGLGSLGKLDHTYPLSFLRAADRVKNKFLKPKEDRDG